MPSVTQVEHISWNTLEFSSTALLWRTDKQIYCLRSLLPPYLRYRQKCDRSKPRQRGLDEQRLGPCREPAAAATYDAGVPPAARDGVARHLHALTTTPTHYTALTAGFIANSKYKIPKFKHFSRTFKDQNCIFQAPKLSTKSDILDADIQNLDCNVTLKQAKWNQILFPSTCGMHTSACFKIVNKCKISKFARFKFKDFSRIFKYFQAPYLFSSTFKSLEVFIPNSSIFKDFSSTLWTLWLTTALFCVCLVQDARYCIKSVFHVAIETVKLSFSSYVYDW